MKLRHHDIEIPKDNPFENCKLGRGKYADVLTSIVTNYADGFVLAIDNKWGTGKTTFIKMWKRKLEIEGFKTLYFNAWENDFESDVLVALISELSELEDKPEKEFKLVLKKVLPLLGKLLPSVLKHLVKKKIGDEAAEDLAEAFGDYTADQLKEATEKYTSRKKSIEEFKDCLKAFAIAAGNGKPIIFMIDELDRCRPSYAVEVLEQIKHLFSVLGIVFVLSVDKEQLGHAVRGVYGSDRINADEYLRRFIDVSYSLPEVNKDNYVDYLYDYFEFKEFFEDPKRLNNRELQKDKSNFLSFAKSIFQKLNSSLRQIEKLFAKLRVSLNSFDYNGYVFPLFLLLLIYIQEHKKDLYNKVKNKELSLQQLLDNLENIFPEFMGDIEEVYPLMRANIQFLKLYENYINHHNPNTIKLVEGDVHSNDAQLTVKSKYYNDSNNNDEMLTSLMFFERHYGFGRVGIDFFCYKIELLDNFK